MAKDEQKKKLISNILGDSQGIKETYSLIWKGTIKPTIQFLENWQNLWINSSQKKYINGSYTDEKVDYLINKTYTEYHFLVCKIGECCQGYREGNKCSLILLMGA